MQAMTASELEELIDRFARAHGSQAAASLLAKCLLKQCAPFLEQEEHVSRGNGNSVVVNVQVIPTTVH